MLNCIGKECIPLIEYTLIADEYGKVHEESMPQAHAIKVGKELRVKIRRLYRDGLLGVISIINPLHYREYLILRVSAYAPKPLVKEVSVTINEIERHSCKEKKFVIVATVPQKWEYFCCSIKYLRRLEGVVDKISLLEEVNSKSSDLATIVNHFSSSPLPHTTPDASMVVSQVVTSTISACS
jgi:hypothetical protein